MKKFNVLISIVLLFVVFSCSKKAEMAPMADSTAVSNYISSSAAKVDEKDKTHQFIRTADLRFKVKNVIKSTYEIEDIAGKLGGFVTYSSLKSEANYTDSKAISADSTLETTHFTITNEIIIRVPNTRLDTALKLIARNIDFLDYRVIKADDVALQLLSNKLTQHRNSRHQHRVSQAIDTKSSKLSETTNAEQNVTDSQEQNDNAQLSNLSLKEQINFSTITLNIYQRESLKRELVANPENIKEYQPSLGSQLWNSIQTGWDIFVVLILFLFKMWGVILIAGLIYLTFKYIRKFFKKDK